MAASNHSERDPLHVHAPNAERGGGSTTARQQARGRGGNDNCVSNFNLGLTDTASDSRTANPGRAPTFIRGHGRGGRGRESEYRDPRGRAPQHPRPETRDQEAWPPGSLRDGDLPPSAQFFAPHSPPPRGSPRERATARKHECSGREGTRLGEAGRGGGGGGYGWDRELPVLLSKCYSDDDLTRPRREEGYNTFWNTEDGLSVRNWSVEDPHHPSVTAEEVLQQHFTDFNRHPPYLTDAEYKTLFDQARKSFDPFGLTITIEDIYKVLEEKTFFDLVLKAKKNRLGEGLHSARSPDDISLPDIPRIPFGQAGLNSKTTRIGEGSIPSPKPTPTPFQSGRPSSDSVPQATTQASPGTTQDLRVSAQTQRAQQSSQPTPFPTSLISHLTPNPIITATSNQFTMATPTIDNFLAEISVILRQQDGTKLQSFLLIEPKFPTIYNTMISELQYTFPPGTEAKLEAKCSQAVPEAREGIDGSPWTAFIKFTLQYFTFLRDVNVDDLLKTYNQLSELVQKCNSALVHHSLGMIILPTVVAYSKVLTRLAIGLDKRPDLMIGTAKVDESGERITLPERAANMMRNAFVTCLNDRSGGPSGVQDGRPAGKKVGIYKIANLCLKILFQCGKSHNSQTIFNNIHKQSPPLSIYPRSERVTYLYYLGCFHFTMSHFYRAQLALQAAYDECPRYSSCQSQRRLILIYLITSNMLLGRFPSEELYNKPEAQGFRERFQPLCRAIAKGDLETFRRLTDDKHKYHSWFWHYCIQLQLKHRCEVLVWRSLARKTFMLNGVMGDPANKIAPTFQIEDFAAVLRRLEIRAMHPLRAADTGAGNRHTNWIFMPDEPPRSAIYIHPEFEGVVNVEDIEDPWLLPDASEAESIVASLVHQGFLNGFISHRLLRFAIQGARTRPALQAGFPRVWDVIRSRFDDEVPGWKRDMRVGTGFTDGDGPRNAGMPVGFI